MKFVKDNTGRFALRPHYGVDELDEACEQIITRFLKTKNGVVTFPVSTDDLASLLETETADLDLYADLTVYGEHIEGVTIFTPGQKPVVKIERMLSEDTVRQNRLRTTLTHEYGHVHFHSSLFERTQASFELFPSELTVKSPSELQLCKRETMVSSNFVDWMEWQAGHVCGAILMPKTSVQEVFRNTWPELAGKKVEPSTKLAADIVSVIKNKYEVSDEAARVRLSRLHIFASLGKTSVGLNF